MIGLFEFLLVGFFVFVVLRKIAQPFFRGFYSSPSNDQFRNDQFRSGGRVDPSRQKAEASKIDRSHVKDADFQDLD